MNFTLPHFLDYPPSCFQRLPHNLLQYLMEGGDLEYNQRP
jgi:hypothetical protein